MRTIVRSLGLLALLHAFPASGSAAERADTTLTLGDRPAVVAFFGLPIAAADDDPDVAQVIADLHFFLKDSRAPLESLGVDVHEIYEPAIHLRTPARAWDLPLRPGLPLGYYLWAPKGPAYVCRGVSQSADLVAIVGLYLDEIQKGAPSKLIQCERQNP